MIHARKDYNRIQDPAADDETLATGGTPIGEFEPVMLFRAQDKHFIKVISHYIELVASDEFGDREEREKIILTCGEQIRRGLEWQKSHRTKSPDIP